MSLSPTTNAVESLLNQVTDPNLRAELTRAVEEALRDRKFGLVFEEHLPEVQALPGAPIRVGTRVAVKDEPLNCTYHVTLITERSGVKWADVRRESGLENQVTTREIALGNLIPVARYGEAIYPSLVPTERVERAPDAPFHSIINADNYHALQLLLYGYQNSFDVIYIDPPYNTGARDWKYNNDYVDKADRFRHSKWLSMMKKRLILAHRLVKQGDGVLVIAIDDNELHHLSLLLEQLFPEMMHQVVTTVINPGGTYQTNFARVHEYLYFLCPQGVESIVGREVEEEEKGKIELWKLRRTGAHSAHRHQRPRQFYAIYVDSDKMEPVKVGPEIGLDESYSLEEVDGLIPIYPIDGSGTLRVWRYGRDTMAEKINEKSIVAKVSRGAIQLYYQTIAKSEKKLKTVWYEPTHSSVGTAGVVLIDAIFGHPNVFSFPKSLYAVKDTLIAAVRDKPDALILDFFAGSGTTLHATMLLNAEDGGQRRCVLVTNNEVSEDEAKALTAKGFKPGDDEWEREGICRAVTIPRCKYAINGERDDGTPLPGTYLSGRALSEGFEANLQAFSLDFLDPLGVERGGKFADIAPILWLMAGAKGDLISPADIADKSRPFLWPKGSEFLVCLHDERMGETLTFLHAIPTEQRARLKHIFIVTNAREAWSEWREVLHGMVPGAQVHQLYRDYLENYRLGENRRITDESLVGSLDEDTE